MSFQAASFPDCSAVCPFVAGLMEKIQELESELRKHDNPNTPSSKKRKRKTKRNQKREKSEEETGENPEGESEDGGERFPGKPKGAGGGGISIPDTDDVQHHTLNWDGLEEIGTREKTVIELAENPFEVVKHVIHTYENEQGEKVEPEVDLPEGIYGKRFQAFVTLLRGLCGASHEKIAEIVRQIRPDLTFSSSTSLNITNKISEKTEEERQGILGRVKQNKFVHMDETPLRIDGVSGWVWVFAGPQHVVYRVSLSRSKDIPEETMSGYDGTGVVDGYPGYNGFTKQRDWDHLWREVKETRIEEVMTKFHELRRRAEGMKEKPPPEREEFIRKARGSEFPALIETLRARSEEKKATKIENALPDMFRGVTDPDIPLSNNHAERLLRKVVVHRKLWGCIRNKKGARFIENTLSCMETWKLQEKNVFQKLQEFTS